MFDFQSKYINLIESQKHLGIIFDFRLDFKETSGDNFRKS